MEHNNSENIDMQIIAEASGRHIHISSEDFSKIFWKQKELTWEADLSQPGQFLSKERITIRTKKCEIHSVAILGPFRPTTQVEISKTDAIALGISPPINESGDLTMASDIEICTDFSSVMAKAIIPKRHIHLTTQDAKKFGVTDKQTVAVRIISERSTEYSDVLVRVSDKFKAAFHMDFDEANACAHKKGDICSILPLHV